MIVAVCGLHGGAGTTTVAILLATAAADRTPRGVLLCDTDPSAGDLALALQTTSPHSLGDVARLAAARRSPTQAPFADLPGGLRALAHPPARRAAASPEAVAQVLRDAAAMHELVVVDAGPVTSQHAVAALEVADVVLWTIDATTQPRRAAQILSGPLATEARDARWLLATSATGRDHQVTAAAQLAELVPSLSALIYVPRTDGPPADDESRRLAGQQLLSAIA